MDHRHHDEPLARQRGGEIVQGQRGSGVAMGQHQHRETTDGDAGIFAGFDGIALEYAGVFLVAGRIEGDGTHRLQVQRIEEAHLMEADAPVRMWRRCGVH
ncbi:hypothetical protein D3C85_1680870 [compost metagenome]